MLNKTVTPAVAAGVLVFFWAMKATADPDYHFPPDRRQTLEKELIVPWGTTLNKHPDVLIAVDRTRPEKNREKDDFAPSYRRFMTRAESPSARLDFYAPRNGQRHFFSICAEEIKYGAFKDDKGPCPGRFCLAWLDFDLKDYGPLLDLLQEKFGPPERSNPWHWPDEELEIIISDQQENGQIGLIIKFLPILDRNECPSVPGP